MIELKNCPICKESKWENLDALRDPKYWYDRDYRLKDEPVGFKICKECGFITYDMIENDRLNDIYTRIRPLMNAENIVTCNRKNKYHEKFLGDFFEEFNKYPKEKRTGYKFLDVGCAQGSFLNLLKERLACNSDNIYGTEWSDGFRAYAKHEYKLKVTKEVDESMKYDFISYYHVFEHIQEPNKEIRKINKILKDDGLLYMSVPIWIETCDETSGGMTLDFENYYHLNHVNVFTPISYENIIKSNGFEIIKANRDMYGYTILCKKTDTKFDIIKENWQDIAHSLELERAAIGFMTNPEPRLKKPEEAIKLRPNFPDAYIMYSVNAENMKVFSAQEKILLDGLGKCPDNTKIKAQLGRLYSQWDQNTPEKVGFYSNNVRKAEEIFLDLIESKPGNEDLYFFLAKIEGDYKKNYDKAVEYLKIQLEINPKTFPSANNFIALYWSRKEKAVDMDKPGDIMDKDCGNNK